MKLEPANIVCPKCGNGNYMRHLIGTNVGWLDVKCINCNSYFNFDELYKQKIVEVVKPKTNATRSGGEIMTDSLCLSCIHKNVCKFAVTLVITNDGKMIDDTPLKSVIKCTHYIEAKEARHDLLS